MPDRPAWLDDLHASMQEDPSLDRYERERRARILRDIGTLVQQKGERNARPHPDRARQFMPFAALKGYHDLAHGRERVPEPKRAMTDERAAALSNIISRLAKGMMVSAVHYAGDCYTTTCGVVTEINEAFRTISIVRKAIAFDDILSIEVLGDAPAAQG